MGYLLEKGDFLYYLRIVIKKHKIMETLLLLLNKLTKTFLHFYFKNEDEAINWWNSFKAAEEWEMLYLKGRGRSGHRYEMECAKFDPCGELYSKYIVCYSKKEALYLKKILREKNPLYLFYIKRLY